MFTPNPEQIKSLLRWLVTMFGASIAGWFAAKGWFTSQQVLDALNSPVVAGLVVSLISAAMGLFTHTQANAVAVADAVPGNAGVIMKDTPEGRAIAAASVSPTIVVEGTPAAEVIASK